MHNERLENTLLPAFHTPAHVKDEAEHTPGSSLPCTGRPTHSQEDYSVRELPLYLRRETLARQRRDTWYLVS
ncbi:hypothetical protein E2C01_081026 [Portunus trituberculatus]|uniref:Uncharacterized protein n=1 Tax=Portunus trituberculatus TaxID=210409 RepID=A0A5B7IZY7_PORTR|nr:hypothetical protein [Portunus trituberculatus]